MSIRSFAVGVCARGLIVAEDTSKAMQPVSDAFAQFGADVKVSSIELRRIRAIRKLEALGETVERTADKAMADLQLEDFEGEPA